MTREERQEEKQKQERQNEVLAALDAGMHFFSDIGITKLQRIEQVITDYLSSITGFPIKLGGYREEQIGMQRTNGWLVLTADDIRTFDPDFDKKSASLGLSVNASGWITLGSDTVLVWMRMSRWEEYTHSRQEELEKFKNAGREDRDKEVANLKERREPLGDGEMIHSAVETQEVIQA